MRDLFCGMPWMPVWDAGLHYVGTAEAGSSVICPRKEQALKILKSFSERDVLIIDDEASVVRLTSLMLQQLGLTVRGTVSGLDGVELWMAQRATIGVLILDIMLADTNGLDVYERIRPLDRDLPIVLASGISQPEYLDAILCEDKRTRFLPKPFGARDLRQVLADFDS